MFEWQLSSYGNQYFLVHKESSEILEEIDIHSGIFVGEVDYYSVKDKKFKDLEKAKEYGQQGYIK